MVHTGLYSGRVVLFETYAWGYCMYGNFLTNTLKLYPHMYSLIFTEPGKKKITNTQKITILIIKCQIKSSEPILQICAFEIIDYT